MSVADVCGVLSRERDLLELLLFKLEEEQLVLSSGRTRWLAHATREVEAVLARIREVEVDRAAAVDLAAAELGLPPGPSLARLAAAAPAPWSEVLAAHREAFLVLAAEVSTTASANRDLLHTGLASLGEALAAADDAPVTYGRDRGRAATTPASAAGRLVDEAV